MKTKSSKTILIVWNVQKRETEGFVIFRNKTPGKSEKRK